MVSPDDAAALQSIGHDTIQDFVAVVVETFVIAIYALLVLKATDLLLRKRRTKVSFYTGFAVLVMFGLALALWMIDIHNVVHEVQATLLSTSTASLSDTYPAAVSEVLRLAAVEDYLYAFMTNIGDSIIIWRVYAFWWKDRGRLVVLLPLACLLGSVSTSSMLTYCAARLGADIELGAFRKPEFCRNIQTASYSMALATTGVSTILISYKAWEYRRVHIEIFGRPSWHAQRPKKIMALLIESGVLYMLFFLVQVIGSLRSVNALVNKNAAVQFGWNIYDFITSLIVGMYPTIVVILVHSERYVLGFDTAATASTRGGIAFKSAHGRSNSAYPTVNSSTTIEMGGLRAPATAVDLYEMARLSPSGSAEVSDLKGGGGGVGGGLGAAGQIV